MRLQSILGIILFALAIPAFPDSAPLAVGQTGPQTSGGLLSPKEKGTFNEASVDKIDGTVMVQHPDGSKPTALQTGSVIEKGDTLLVYDKSWVILKTHRGDQIGFDENTTAVVDEYYFRGPDRQVRLILQKGSIFLRTNGDSSRQSFFEVNAGSNVASIDNVQAILTYTPADEHLRAQYINGHLTVIDKDAEEKFTVQHSEHNWKNGKMQELDPEMTEELDVANYHKFMDGDPRLVPSENNILFKGGY